MKIKLTLATPQIDISNNAKVCYHTNTKKDITSSVVGDKGHLAVLRFAYATFHIEEISIPCHVQMLRSSHLEFLVESKRYVSPKKGGFSFIMPINLNKSQSNVMQKHWKNSIKLYDELISSGVKKEDARAILPTNTSTSLNVTGNLQAWYDFLTLRLNKHAQLEIRNLAEIIYNILLKEYPLVFTEKLFLKMKN